jgi:hypothetical protein
VFELFVRLPEFLLVGLCIASVVSFAQLRARQTTPQLIYLLVLPILFMLVEGIDIAARLTAQQPKMSDEAALFLSSWQAIDRGLTYDIIYRGAPASLKESTAQNYIHSLFGDPPDEKAISDYFERFSGRYSPDANMTMKCLEYAHTEAAIGPLTKIATNPHLDGMTLQASVQSIKGIGGPKAIEALRIISSSADLSPQVRSDAQYGLVELGDATWVLSFLPQMPQRDAFSLGTRIYIESTDAQTAKMALETMLRNGSWDPSKGLPYPKAFSEAQNNEIMFDVVSTYMASLTDHAQLQAVMSHLTLYPTVIERLKAQFAPILMGPDAKRLDCNGEHKETCDLLFIHTASDLKFKLPEGCSNYRLVAHETPPYLRVQDGGGGWPIYDFQSCVAMAKANLANSCHTLSPPGLVDMLVSVKYTDDKDPMPLVVSYRVAIDICQGK